MEEERIIYPPAGSSRDWEIEVEINFLTAYLRDAYSHIEDISNNGVGRGKKYLKSAVSSWLWINGRQLRTALPFDDVCEALGCDADYVRSGLCKIVERAGKTEFFEMQARSYY